MNRKYFIVALVGLLLAGTLFFGTNIALAVTEIITNGVTWNDTSNNVIHAHGGGMLKEGNYYYWFGENRYDNQYLQFKSVTCYRSTNLKDWEFVNDVLTDQSDSDLNYAKIERPKVIYNSTTGQYVMWMHKEYAENYSEARAAVATSDTVCGDYQYQGSFRPLNHMSRDDTLFVDDDGTAYFISAANENYDLHIYRLTADYEGIDALVYQFVGDHREAPAMFKRNGVYFLITSGATGWNPNQGQYAYSSNISSGWSSWQNVGNSTSYDSQPTYVLPVQGSQTTSYLYQGDRWQDPGWFDSKYVWLPIEFNSNTSISLNWHDAVSIDTETGVISSGDTDWTKVDDDHSSVSYSSGWGTWSGNPGYQGTEHYSDNTGSVATFTFNGTRARYYGFKRSDLGFADIYVDGVYQTSIDLYNSNSAYDVLIYETNGLAAGMHTLQVEVSGNSSAASSGAEIIVDAFSSIDEGGEPTATPTNTPTSTPTSTNTPVGPTNTPTSTPTAQPGGLIPQTNWTLHYVDSEETSGEDGAATNAFDSATGTIWHTEWESSSPTHPHEIQINLGASYDVDGFRYLPRQDGSENGRISQYEFYVSADGSNWGSAVAGGTFTNSSTEKEVTFAAKTGQYVRLVALSEVNGNAWTSAAEINVLGSSSGGPTPTPTNTPVGPTNTPTPTSTPSSSTYQAEDASLGGGVSVDSNHTGYNGSGFVNFPSSGGYMEYQNVDGGSGGSSTLEFRFALGASSARTGSLIVNGSSQNITFQPTGAWNSWNTMNVTVNLNSGTGNTIRLESTGQDLANQDQLTVN